MIEQKMSEENITKGEKRKLENLLKKVKHMSDEQERNLTSPDKRNKLKEKTDELSRTAQKILEGK